MLSESLEDAPEHVRLLVAVREQRFEGSRARLAAFLDVSYKTLYRWETSWNSPKPYEPPGYLVPWLKILLRPEAAGTIASVYLASFSSPRENAA